MDGKDGKLPLKVQVAIRDLWEKETSAAQVARKALADVLGFAVRCQPQWRQLLSAYEDAPAASAGASRPYADDGPGLVTAVAGSVEVWCKVLTDLLDHAYDANGSAQQAWAEALLGRLTSDTALTLFIDVGPVAEKSETAWDTARSAFVLRLPARSAVSMPAGFAVDFRSELLACFDEKTESLAHRAAEGDDWAVVGGSDDYASKPTAAAATSKGPLQFLPSVETLPRPEVLLSRPPYHLVVSAYGSQDIVVQGSHAPSLRLLSDYLKRWCQINHNDSRNPPAVNIKLHKSCWGTSSDTVDKLTLKVDNHIFTINPALVLAFVEGVLGYTQVDSHSGVWHFRRDVLFK